MALTQVSTNGIADGAVTANDLENSGVTAGTYGSSSAIPAITVDAKGRVTSASTSSIDSTAITNGTSNVSVAASGDITITRDGTVSATFGNGNININDDIALRFGTGADLKIYHTNNQSYIEDAGVGSLTLKTDGANIAFQKGSTETLAIFKTDGACELYHDNSKKLETTSTGIDVTGSVTCDGMTCEGSALISAGSGVLQIRDNDGTGGANSVVYIQGQRNDGTGIWTLGDVDSTADIYLANASDATIYFQTNGTNRVGINNGGLFPHANNTSDLGTSTNQWRDGYFDGTVNCDGLDVAAAITCDGLTADGNLTMNASNGLMLIKDSDNTGVAATPRLEGQQSNGGAKWRFGNLSSGSDDVYVANDTNNKVIFNTNLFNRAYVDSTGFHPISNNTYDLGTASLRWANVYTNDLNLSNEGGANDVDGTWGSWTIQEGEDDLFLLNRRNGKKYKFNLTEVN